MNGPGRRSLLLVISAPSGAGKTTLCRRLLGEFEGMTYSVSCTTRPPRAGEKDGRDYIFLSEEEFRRRVDAGEFLEHATVHGYRYGTLRSTVEDALGAGHDVLMDIDVQGAASLRAVARGGDGGDVLRGAYVDVFIAPPSLGSLRQRLEGRNQDSGEVIAARLQKAADEMAHWREYMYFIINDDIESAYDALRAVVLAEHHRVVA